MRTVRVDFNAVQPDGTVYGIVAPLDGIAIGDTFRADDGEGTAFEAVVERVDQNERTGLAVIVFLRCGVRLP